MSIQQTQKSIIGRAPRQGALDLGRHGLVRNSLEDAGRSNTIKHPIPGRKTPWDLYEKSARLFVILFVIRAKTTPINAEVPLGERGSG
jgi:hypothetical protein